jgi:hypothetical protein
MKFDIWFFSFENQSRKFKFHENLTRITSALQEDLFIFFDKISPISS